MNLFAGQLNRRPTTAPPPAPAAVEVTADDPRHPGVVAATNALTEVRAAVVTAQADLAAAYQTVEREKAALDEASAAGVHGWEIGQPRQRLMEAKDERDRLGIVVQRLRQERLDAISLVDWTKRNARPALVG